MYLDLIIQLSPHEIEAHSCIKKKIEHSIWPSSIFNKDGIVLNIFKIAKFFCRDYDKGDLICVCMFGHTKMRQIPEAC